ncbi:hypothetical protein [Hydrogenophaga sp.]|uniref:hypothetical protein n=1 Tax=Hydrogenophaga sp. TaxID=1904254 RepID=UPI00286DC31B|nr:hypothetical protein [Hydrogenophaga sp.]
MKLLPVPMMSFRPLVLALAGLSAAVALAADLVETPTVETPTVEAPTVEATVSPSARQQSFALQIARANLVQQGVTEPTTEQMALATADVQSLRDQGMGWGAIANSLGLRLGAVVSAENRAAKAQTHVAAAASSDQTSARGQGAGSSNGKGGGGGKGGGNGGGGGGGKR